jgi:hypothetical protein
MSRSNAVKSTTEESLDAPETAGAVEGDELSQPRRPAAALPWLVSVAGAIVWLFAIVAAYFWAHKPFDADMLAGLGRSVASLAVWLGITWLGAALGRRALAGLLAGETPALRLSLSAGLGLGLLSLAALGLGLAGALHPAAAWGLVLVLGVLLRRELRASAADLRTTLSGSNPVLRSGDRFQGWLAVYMAGSLTVALLAALAPPTGWDALVYHMTGPRLFLEAGRVGHPIDLPYLGFPQLAEMQFALGMLLLGDGVAPLLHFGYGLLAVLVTAGLAGRIFGRGAAWPAAALLLSVPSLLSLMSRAYVEATLLFYVTAAMYAFVRWRESRATADARPGSGWLWLAALFCGFSAGVKYTAVAVPVALGLSLIWSSRGDGLRQVAGRLVQFGAITAAVAAPWLLENWLTTGNPVYPFFLTGRYWDSWRAWWYDRPGTGLAATAPWRMVIAPLEATVLGVEGGAPYDATLGPLLLAVAPLLALVWRGLKREERAATGHLLLFFGLNYLLWLAGLARSALLVQTRLLLPVFGVVAVLGAGALDRLAVLRRPQLAVDWLVRAVVGLTLALLLFSNIAAFLRANPLPVAFGLESRDAYLERRLGAHYLAIRGVNALPADSHVVFLWEPRSYYCRVDCRPDALLDRFLHLASLHPDAAGIAGAWQAEGVTHVLLYRSGFEAIRKAGFDPVGSRETAMLEELQADYLSPIEEWGDAYALYELEAAR